MRKSYAQVVIAWSNDGETLATLGYSSGRGPIRTYYKDRYDSRCGADLPYFRFASDALAHILSHKGIAGAAQVDVRNKDFMKAFEKPLAEVATEEG